MEGTEASPERDETIRVMRASGARNIDICRTLGISESELMRRIHRLGLPVREQRRRPPPVVIPRFPAGVPSLPPLPSLMCGEGGGDDR